MKIYYLSDKFPWLGEHSGYNRLIFYIQKQAAEIKVVSTRFGLGERLLGKIYSLSRGAPGRQDLVYAASEAKFLLCLSGLKKQDICHVLYYDNHFFMWARREKGKKNIIGTIHHPPDRTMHPLMLKNLKYMSGAIILCRRELDFYEAHIGAGRVKFIPHGVDTDFFRPPEKRPEGPRRLLFTGQNGRNTAMFYRVVKRLSERYPDVYFDLLVRREKRGVEGLKELINHPRVLWHENLPDEGLLGLYQKSYLLLQPMESCSANNAIVESLACGLPVVTTDVGGVHDYGAGTVYPTAGSNDDEAMFSLVERYFSDAAWHSQVSKNCRVFAEQNLSWPLIARAHIRAYEDLLR